MGEQSEQCPTCAKPVMGRTALLAHLEFSHDIAEPTAFLHALEEPERPRRDWRPVLKRTGVAIAGVAAAAIGFVVFSAATDGDADADVDAAAAATSETSAPPPTTVPPTTQAPTTTLPPTTSTTTTVPPTTAPPTTQALALDSGLIEADFRKPFLRDAHVVLCRPSSGDDIYRVGFTLSGSRDIRLDDVDYPDRSGDGLHVVDRPIASGSTTYLDEILVSDGGGTEHEVPIAPPLYLGDC